MNILNKMKNTFWRYFFVLTSSALWVGCSSTRIFKDETPIKVSSITERKTLSDAVKKRWFFSDPVLDTLPGISLEKTKEVVGNRKASEVIVAIVDSGVDINHPLFENKLWVNEDEIPGNNIDDDANGFVDDVHGYNFLGESYYEQMEYVRMIAKEIGDEEQLKRARIILEKELPKAEENKRQYKRIYELAKTAVDTLSVLLNDDQFNSESLRKFTPESAFIAQQKALALQFLSYTDRADLLIKDLFEGVTYYTERSDYNLNVNFNGRELIGDDPYDIADTGYGNGNVINRLIEESHGTHVAGIVSQIAPFAKLMILRTVPAGDEYDKDVALAIRYAADNGAKIINCSFGKSFSPQRKWVEDAISYAESKGALIVHAAGNESEDLDVLKNTNYPDDQPNFNTEFASNFLSVGALAPYFNQGLIADFSNYGKEKVDLFAPGEDIYSSMPNAIFAFQGGTSMAAPVVSGVAAWIAAYFPKHQGPALKKILMDSSIRLPINVLTPDNEEINSFARFSKSGGIVNLYNALLLAQNRY